MDAAQVLVLDERQVGERELVGDQHAVLGERALGLGDAEEVAQDAEPDVLHVDRAVAEIAVRHAHELLDVLLDHALERRLGRQAVVDRGLELAREAGVLEHQAVRVDDAAVELGEPLREPLLQVLELGYGSLERALQAPLLLLGMVGARLVDQPEADRRLEEVRLAAAEAGCGGEPVEPRPAAPGRRLGTVGGLLVGLQALDGRHHPAAELTPLVLLALQVLHQARRHDDGADLGGDLAQDADLVRGEPAAPERLHDQHADRRAALDERHAEEGVVLLLAGLREELVAGVRDRIDRHHRLELLDRHAGEPLLDAHRHLADGVPVEADGRPQREALRAWIEDVERADVRADPLGHHLDDPLEGFLEVLGARRDGADVLEHGEAVRVLRHLLGTTPRRRGRLASLRLHEERARS